MFENSFTPKKSVEDLRKERKIKGAALDMVLEMMLSSDAPEEEKIRLRIVKTHEVIDDMLMDILVSVTAPGLEDSPELLETREKVLEYFNAVGAGIQQFMEITPLPNHEERR